MQWELLRKNSRFYHSIFGPKWLFYLINCEKRACKIKISLAARGTFFEIIICFV
jgi:hypothetical protein